MSFLWKVIYFRPVDDVHFFSSSCSWSQLTRVAPQKICSEPADENDKDMDDRSGDSDWLKRGRGSCTAADSYGVEIIALLVAALTVRRLNRYTTMDS